jgi:hypothetical protein
MSDAGRDNSLNKKIRIQPEAIYTYLLFFGERPGAGPAPRIAAESPQQARSDSEVRARTCSAEPEFGAPKKRSINAITHRKCSGCLDNNHLHIAIKKGVALG